MNVSVAKGDIFKADWDAFCHCVNIYNIMGAGIAVHVAKLFPEAKRADDLTTAGDVTKLGTFSTAMCQHPSFPHPVRVGNLYAQEGLGSGPDPLDRNLRYDLLHDTLFHFMARCLMDGRKPLRLAMPWMGCGLAGGDRSIVRAVVESVATRFPLIGVTIYEL